FPACRIAVRAGWTADPSLGRSLSASRGRAQDGSMTTALITGANKGIGYQTARLLGARGMTVLAAARDAGRRREAERAVRGGGAAARFVQLDVTDETSVTSAAKLVEAEFGVLDILVNNAGIARGDAAGKPSQTTLATLREVYETNVFGVVAVTNAM